VTFFGTNHVTYLVMGRLGLNHNRRNKTPLLLLLLIASLWTFTPLNAKIASYNSVKSSENSFFSNTLLFPRNHLNFSDAIRSVQAIINNHKHSQKDLTLNLATFLKRFRTILVQRKKNLSKLNKIIIRHQDINTFGTEQSSTELTRRRQVLEELLGEMSRLPSLFHRGHFSPIAKDLVLLIAGEEFYLKLFWIKGRNIFIVPSEGEIKNRINPQRNQEFYKLTALGFFRAIRKASSSPEKAERVFAQFTKQYHLYIDSWEQSLYTESINIPEAERRVLKNYLSKLKPFFTWNNHRDTAIVQRLKSIPGKKILFIGTGHTASLESKLTQSL